jgi:hypothetical protein
MTTDLVADIARDVVRHITESANALRVLADNLPAKIDMALMQRNEQAAEKDEKYRLCIPSKNSKFTWVVRLVSANGIPLENCINCIDGFYWAYGGKYYRVVPTFREGEIARQIKHDCINSGKWIETRTNDMVFKLHFDAVECECPARIIKEWRQSWNYNDTLPRDKVWGYLAVTNYLNVHLDGKEILHTSSHAFPSVLMDHFWLMMENKKGAGRFHQLDQGWHVELPQAVVDAVRAFIEKCSGCNSYAAEHMALINDYNKLYIRNMELEAKLITSPEAVLLQSPEYKHKLDLLNAKLEAVERRSQILAVKEANAMVTERAVAQPMTQDLCEPFLKCD